MIVEIKQHSWYPKEKTILLRTKYLEFPSKAVKNHVPIMSTGIRVSFLQYTGSLTHVCCLKINATQIPVSKDYPLHIFLSTKPPYIYFPILLPLRIYKLIQTLRIGILSLNYMSIRQIILQIVMKID